MEIVIGTLKAKTNLSALLAIVEAGETVTITRRDVPIARLVPIPQQDQQPEETEVKA